MNKIIVTFMLLFFIATLLSAVMEGGGGANTTRLTVGHSAVVTTLNVASTDGFMKNSWVQVGNERIAYTNKTSTTFTGCDRGYDGTTASAHLTRTKVYSEKSNILNAALGFNIASTGASVGVLDIPIMIGRFFSVTMPTLILWDYSWLKGDDWLSLLRIAFQAISIGFVIYIAMMIASALGGILQGIFRI